MFNKITLCVKMGMKGDKNMSDAKTLYENIKKRRIKLNMSQQELAEAVGYSGKSMISQVENGLIDLPITMVKKFAEVLQTEPGDLMGWDDLIIGDFNTTPEEEKAKELYDLYENATPEVQSAVELLLRSSQLPSESPLKNINTVE